MLPTPTTSAITAASREFQSATRVQDSVLNAIEKRTLIWLAERMPRWVNSDHLTLLALAAMIGAGASYWLSSVTPLGLVLVVICLAVNWFGDSLDGTLARVRQLQRPRYGYYVDHVVDVFGTLVLFAGLALSGYMSPAVAAALLIAYYLLTLEVFLATHSLGRFQMSFFKMGPTELRIVLALGNLVLLVHPMATILGREYRLFDVGGAVAIAGMFTILLVNVITNTRTLYRQEPIARSATPAAPPIPVFRDLQAPANR